MSRSELCVVIPHFNRAELLRQTLDSVLSQGECAWQVVVVDDGSDAEHWEQIRQYADSRVRIIRREDGEKGPSRCRNLGWQSAETELVMFLDSDDLLGNWCLAQRLEATRANSDADAWVFPVLLFRQTPGDLRTLWNRMEGDRELERFLVSDPPWHTSSTLWRRRTLESLGGFNEKVMYGDDADLHMRAILSGVRFFRMPAALPDVFIRRAGDERITNTVSGRLLDSRLVRLREGSQFLQNSIASKSNYRLWQGQYFRECEYLLFNVEDSWWRTALVLKAWQTDWPEEFLIRAVCIVYLWVAYACLKRARILLRVSRRIAMLVLPGGFFPKPGGFECTEPSDTVWTALTERLGSSCRTVRAVES